MICVKQKYKNSAVIAFHYDIPTTQIAQNGSQSQMPLGLLHFIHKVLDGCPAKCCEETGAGFIQTLIGMYGQPRMSSPTEGIVNSFANRSIYPRGDTSASMK